MNTPKYKLTEEQYNALVQEGVILSLNPADTGGDINKAVQNTQNSARQAGVDLNKASIQIPAKPSNESRYITKEKLDENRTKFLKRNSIVCNVSDFIK